MAEIILDVEKALEAQLQKVLALADKLGVPHSLVRWLPQSGTDGQTLPHGGLVEVPDELAKAHAKSVQLEAARNAKRSPEAASDNDPKQE